MLTPIEWLLAAILVMGLMVPFGFAVMGAMNDAPMD